MGKAFKPNSETTDTIQLLRELQQYYYEIARTAEAATDINSFFEIQKQADHALKLIDSCIQSKQVEMGQQTLDFSPFGVGSIMHEAAFEIRTYNQTKTTVVTGVNFPAMTNRAFLKNFLYSSGSFVHQTSDAPITVRSFPAENQQIGIGVFSSNFSVSAKELNKALQVNNNGAMSLPAHNQSSGFMITLADSLAKSLGSKAKIKKIGSLRGIAIQIPRSNQLSFDVE